MKTLPLDASDEEILEAVREWVSLLIKERYADACAFLCNDNGPHQWTPELIATLIENYGSHTSWHEGEIFKVTSLEGAQADPPKHLPPRHDVHRWRDEDSEGVIWLFEGGKKIPIHVSDLPVPNDYIGYVWFDLPLNGYWSDLTATFDLCVLNDQLVLELNDIHVM
jgi:hypothetical protein